MVRALSLSRRAASGIRGAARPCAVVSRSRRRRSPASLSGPRRIRLAARLSVATLIAVWASFPTARGMSVTGSAIAALSSCRVLGVDGRRQLSATQASREPRLHEGAEVVDRSILPTSGALLVDHLVRLPRRHLGTHHDLEDLPDDIAGSPLYASLRSAHRELGGTEDPAHEIRSLAGQRVAPQYRTRSSQEGDESNTH
jgi:hypothetical protein